jgi:hypothetical protein
LKKPASMGPSKNIPELKIVPQVLQIAGTFGII